MSVCAAAVMGNVPPISSGTWTENSTNLCWQHDTDGTGPQCGEIDKCSADIGIILPLFFEGTWPREARATLYLIGLLYSFLGVQILSFLLRAASVSDPAGGADIF